MPEKTAPSAEAGVEPLEAVDAFLSIPFAHDTASARFAVPVDYETPFEGGTFDATKEAPMCLQKQKGSKDEWEWTGSEDCLKLTIWRERASSSDSRPVLVWIHGGCARPRHRTARHHA